MNLDVLELSDDLSPQAVQEFFAALVARSTSDETRIAILRALNHRSTSVADLVAFAKEMRRHAVPFPLEGSRRAIDLCGTGGAPVPSFNVSTVSAFIVAAGGVPVVKHGNRSSRGGCGSSDLLEALGLPVTSSVRFARESFDRFGLAFLHAPLFHPETRAVAAARKAIQVPTIFNQLGPLTNPAEVEYQLTGVGDPNQQPRLLDALAGLGRRGAGVMYSDEGFDEFGVEGYSHLRLATARAGTQDLLVDPSQHLLPSERGGDLRALDPPTAAREATRTLEGHTGPRLGSALLTAGTAFWIADRVPSLAEGVALARKTVDSDAAIRLLQQLRQLAATESWETAP